MNSDVGRNACPWGERLGQVMHGERWREEGGGAGTGAFGRFVAQGGRVCISVPARCMDPHVSSTWMVPATVLAFLFCHRREDGRGLQHASSTQHEQFATNALHPAHRGQSGRQKRLLTYASRTGPASWK